MQAYEKSILFLNQGVGRRYRYMFYSFHYVRAESGALLVVKYYLVSCCCFFFFQKSRLRLWQRYFVLHSIDALLDFLRVGEQLIGSLPIHLECDFC
jgi:hypothetical protein